MAGFPRVPGDRNIPGLEATWKDYERMAKAGSIEEVYSLSGEALCKVAEKTEDPEVAGKLLTDPERLKEGMRKMYPGHGRVQDGVYFIRERHIADLVKRLTKLTRPSLSTRAGEVLTRLGFTRKKVKDVQGGSTQD